MPDMNFKGNSMEGQFCFKNFNFFGAGLDKGDGQRYHPPKLREGD